MNLADTIYRPFTASELSALTNARPESIQTWLKRKLIVGHKKIEGGGSQGKHRRFSFNSVMEIAVAQKLIEMNMSTKEAFKAAADFAHASSGGKVFDLPERDPGIPFHHNHGDTIFGVAGARTFEELYKPGENYDTFGKLRRHLGSEHFIALNASEIFNTICARLGSHPYEVLDTVYPESATT